jgi:flagellar biosynthesis protein FlhF
MMTELKKFEAPTLAEALKVVKRELGPEAIILSTKNNRSGWGLMNQSSVEVTATVSREALDRKRAAESRMSEGQRASLAQAPSQKVAQAYDVLSGSRIQRELNRAREIAPTRSAAYDANPAQQALQNLGAAAKSKTAAKAPASGFTQRRYIDIDDDESPAEQATLMAQDRSQISQSTSHNYAAQQMLRHQQQQQQQVAAQAQAQAQAQSQAQRSSGNQVLPKLLAEIIEAGVEPNLVRELGDELKAIMIREHITREDLLRLQLGRVLMSRLRVGRSLGERLRTPTTPRIITFLGPTGVGKTTTLAKIAAELVINLKRPVTLATTDTFKIAAVEQLQTYANILRIPFEVCPNAESFANLGANLGSEDVVLVDTAGYGPRDESKLHELKELLSGMRTETHLCLASTTRDQDLIKTVKRFKIFEPDYLVVTKLDETSQYGNMFNIAAKSHIPLSYFTMGQRVPEDMEVATKERVADLLLNFAGGETQWTKQTD